MKNISRYIRCQMIIAATLWILVLSTGCNTNIQTMKLETELVFSTVKTTPHITQSQDGSTPTPYNTSTLVSSTGSPTTIKATRTPRIEKPSLTQLPTLSDDQAEEFTLNTQFDSSDCNLPCWWGIIPGETDLATAFKRIIAIGLNVDIEKAPAVWASLKPNREIFSAGVYIQKYSFLTRSVYYSENGMVEVIQVVTETTPDPSQLIFGDPFYLKAMSRLSLQYLLLEYGKPDQVMMYVQDVRIREIGDYFLLLFYPDEGILVQYYGQSKDQNDKLQLCPSMAMINLWLWSPEKALSILELRSHSIMTDEDYQKSFLSAFLPIEEATGMNIDGFYETFKAGRACLVTPSSLWGK